METLTLNDGTVVNGHILDGGDGQTIFVYLDGMSIYEGVTLFHDPLKTSKITELRYGVEHIYEGYTELYAVNHEYGNCNIVMKKP